MTMKYTIAECVARQRQVREEADGEDAMTLSFAYELARLEVDAELPWGREPGTYVNDWNEVRPIRAPRQETKPKKRLVPISVEALVEVDGDVNEAEATEAPIEVEELMPPARIPVAGEDTPEETDEETELFENAADLAATEQNLEGSEGDDDSE
jgi:hypothetical protein